MSLFFAIPTSGPKYTLSGTDVAPNELTTITTVPTSATTNWEFRVTGGVKQQEDASETDFRTGVEWANFTPTEDLWIRFTLTDGGSGGIDPDNAGDVVDVWHALVGAGASHREFGWFRSFAAPGTDFGTCKVEIATDSGGSNIVATGHYKGTSTVNV